MTFIEDLENKINDYMDGDYEVTETEAIPSVENVTFGKKAKKMKLCAFCIDLRKSSDLLDVHQKQTSGKIHKSFLTVVSAIVIKNGGKIRSFNGDGLLAFWPVSTKGQLGQAVETAMIIKWLLDIKFSKIFEKYEKIDFGIGIDWGWVYILRAGISRDANNNDLIFIGKCVNFATHIANQAKGPYHVEISTDTYSNLPREWIYGTSNNQEVDMWKRGVIKSKGEEIDTKITTWFHRIS